VNVTFEAKVSYNDNILHFCSYFRLKSENYPPLLSKNCLFDIHFKVICYMKSYKLFLTLCLLLTLAVGAIAQPQNGPGKAAYNAAKELQKQGKLKEAMGKYDEAVKAEPANYKYYFDKGVCEYKGKEMDWAKESFLKCIEINKDFTPAYSQMAKIAKDQKDYETAASYYEQAVANEKKPDRKVQYELLLVQLLLKQDKIDEAKKHLESARAIDPTNMNLNFYSAELKSAEGNWEQAKAEYTACTESPDFVNLPPVEKAKYYYGLGKSLSKLGDNDGAKKAWEKANFPPYKQLIAQELMKTNHLYFYKIAVSYYLNNELADAEAQADKCLSIQNDFSQAFILKGKIEKKRGEIAKAIEYYETGIKSEKDPANKAKLYNTVANMYMENNDAKGALVYINEALNAAPDNKNLQFLKARAEYESGDYSSAIADLDKQIVAAGSDAKAKAKLSFLLGMACKKSGNTDKAKQAFMGAMAGPYKPAAKIEYDKLTGKAE